MRVGRWPHGRAWVAADPAPRHIAAMAEAVTITLNGAARDVAPPFSVSAMLDGLGLDARKVAVERNEEIVPRSAYSSTILAPGDAVEIVHFIGGG